MPASLISFLIVGGSGVFVHLAVLYAALAATGQFALSQTLAALAAVTSNFLLNNRLTFRDKRLRGTQAGLRLPEIPGDLVDRHRRQRLDRHANLPGGRPDRLPGRLRRHRARHAVEVRRVQPLRVELKPQPRSMRHW